MVAISHPDVILLKDEIAMMKEKLITK